VAKALESISAESSDENGEKSSFDKAEEAVLVTVCAFHRQNDVEQGARLGRKNMQVMDRLAKMQAHKRNSIVRIKSSYGR
jgi:valyl-tRNA synthetase